MSETRILIRLLRMYFPWNWEFGSALSKLRNLGGESLNAPTPLGTPLIQNTVTARHYPIYSAIIVTATVAYNSKCHKWDLESPVVLDTKKKIKKCCDLNFRNVLYISFTSTGMYNINYPTCNPIHACKTFFSVLLSTFYISGNTKHSRPLRFNC
jgi:hypothetical protein